jgi:hypothetical protein
MCVIFLTIDALIVATFRQFAKATEDRRFAQVIPCDGAVVLRAQRVYGTAATATATRCNHQRGTPEYLESRRLFLNSLIKLRAIVRD